MTAPDRSLRPAPTMTARADELPSALARFVELATECSQQGYTSSRAAGIIAVLGSAPATALVSTFPDVASTMLVECTALVQGGTPPSGSQPAALILAALLAGLSSPRSTPATLRPAIRNGAAALGNFKATDPSVSSAVKASRQLYDGRGASLLWLVSASMAMVAIAVATMGWNNPLAAFSLPAGLATSGLVGCLLGWWYLRTKGKVATTTRMLFNEAKRLSKSSSAASSASGTSDERRVRSPNSSTRSSPSLSPPSVSSALAANSADNEETKADRDANAGASVPVPVPSSIRDELVLPQPDEDGHLSVALPEHLLSDLRRVSEVLAADPTADPAVREDVERKIKWMQEKLLGNA